MGFNDLISFQIHVSKPIKMFLSPPPHNLGCQCRSSWSSVPSQNVGYVETNRKVSVIHYHFFCKWKYFWKCTLKLMGVYEHHSKGRNQCGRPACMMPLDTLNENLPTRKQPCIKILSCHVVGLGYNVPLFSIYSYFLLICNQKTW